MGCLFFDRINGVNVTIQVPAGIFSGFCDLNLTTDFLTELTELTELLGDGCAAVVAS